MKIGQWLAVTFYVLGMVGCAPAFHQPLDAEHAATIKTIALVVVPDPFETLGGEALRKADFKFGQPMTAALRDALQRRGYRVFTVPYSDRQPTEFIGDYRLLAATNADAILDARVIHAGYAREITPNPNRFHRPYIHLHTRLVSPKTGKVVFAEMASLVADEITVAGKAVFVPWKSTSPRKYFFPARTFDANDPGPLVNAREAALAGLNASMVPVAEALLNGLKP